MDHDLPTKEVQCGLLHLLVKGKWWTPNHHASEAISQAIRTHFKGSHHHYEKVPKDVQLKWWIYFKSHIT
ncbi:hypothetical protein DEO72_LG7g874 [Vigna unguiculata]|uniref:Uncharacterized protein n=1 Tax=Vigna unguiculata TaxID=3917 RepID=A0A4D6MFQ9_VIGUN|nr:hypothetical protein DEO72_LG7g874 [Vigna unguiculata]